MRIIGFLLRAVDRLSEGIGRLISVLIPSMVVVLAIEVVARYVFNSPEPVSYELSSMFLLLSFVLALTAVEKQDRLLRCDLLLMRFPEHVRNIIANIIAPIMGITFFGIITWISFGDALRALEFNHHTFSNWPVPLFPIKIFIPIGYGFFCIVMLLRLVLGLLHLKASFGKPEISPGQ